LLREVISRYTCEELAAPFDPKRDPRAEIRNELISTLREKMSPGGIEVIGGGIGNLEPDEEALRRRIENWKATWAKRLRVRQAEAEQEAWLSVEQARAEADARFVQHVGNVLQGFVDRGETAALEAIRLRFVGALKAMVRNLPDSMPLPEESVKTLRLLERSGKTNV
jgi:regulator of protease activity HflC (stomatin/prohibitin superfamily)